ncbi:hypothetical protein O181_003379 [Austropuccinia psidii MF-1]|uniref:Uncharacterized protein n=1 Tax=Austropuccinia psidii MF-1 TaxID=1389203 RepID=A0A9Q3BE03_9BASI|nr:hypothetical protein [Austropuccinia psidii MF-1]
MFFIKTFGNNEIVEVTPPVLITWPDFKARVCGNFRALTSFTKADSYRIPRIPHALHKLSKSRYSTQMDGMKCSHQKRFNPNSMKVLRIICHMAICDYTRITFGIKHEPAHLQRMMDTIFQEEILEGCMVV